MINTQNATILISRSLMGIYNSQLENQDKRRLLEAIREQIDIMLTTLPEPEPAIMAEMGQQPKWSV